MYHTTCCQTCPSTAEAQRFIRQFPIPVWVDRDCWIYRGWVPCEQAWEGEQTLEELGLTEDLEQARMTVSPRTKTENPPCPYS